MAVEYSIEVRLAEGDLKRKVVELIESYHYLHSKGSTSVCFAILLQKKTHGLVEWEQLVGGAVYGAGSNPNGGKPFGLGIRDIIDLNRLFILDDAHQYVNHIASQVMGYSLDYLTKHTNQHLAISYSDPVEKHLGIVYQASNWVYLGKSKPDYDVIVDGVQFTQRTIYSKFRTSSISRLKQLLEPNFEVKSICIPGRHKYAYVISTEKAIRKRLTELLDSRRQPYPKESESSGTGK